MTTLVLLPGMDGTGELFAPLLKKLDASIQTQVICYPTQSPRSYQELEELVWQQLPQHTDFYLLGESFSGPIAITIAARKPAHLRGLIFCASFAKNPCPQFAILEKFIPSISHRLVPPFLIYQFLLGRFTTPTLKALLRSAIYLPDRQVMQKRMREILAVDYTSQLTHIKLPSLYLQARHDALVSHASCTILKAALQNLTVLEFDAPHMLLQVVPEQAARAITVFIGKSAHAS